MNIQTHVPFYPCILYILSLCWQEMHMCMPSWAKLQPIVTLYPSIAQLVERWTVVVCKSVIHRSLVQIRFEGVVFKLNFIVELQLNHFKNLCLTNIKIRLWINTFYFIYSDVYNKMLRPGIKPGSLRPSV